MNNIPHIVDTGASFTKDKPVAYVNSMCNDYIDWKIDPISIDGQPLYTRPAKTITDEQIFKLAEMLELKANHALYAFARTLIREAQEK